MSVGTQKYSHELYTIIKLFLYLGIGFGVSLCIEGQAFSKPSSQLAKDFFLKAMDYYRGSSRDYPKALEYFIKAADLGHIDAQLELGKIYTGAEIVRMDYQQAAKWYRKAADQGNANAQLTLGNFYEVGSGVTQDNKKAIQWFTKAAKQGYKKAQLELAFIYRDGIKDIPKDAVKADYYFRKGCFNSDQSVCQNIKAKYHLYDENDLRQ